MPPPFGGEEAGELSLCGPPCVGRVAAEEPTGVTQKVETIQHANSKQRREGYSARSAVAKEPSSLRPIWRLAWVCPHW